MKKTDSVWTCRQTDRHSAPHVCVGCHTCCRTSGSWQLPSLHSCCRRWHHRPGSPMTCPHSYLITATHRITVIWSQQHIGLNSHLITATYWIKQSSDHSNILDYTVIWSQQHIGLHSHLITATHGLHSHLITATHRITVTWSQQHMGLYSHLITATHRITQPPDHSNT